MDTTLKPRPRRGIRAIDIGVQVLRCLAEARKPIALKEVAEKTGLTASNSHFYLTSLVETGLARQEPDTGHYGLGPYALHLGLAAMEQVDVISMSRHILYRLTEELGFSTFLNVWGNHGPTVVYRVDGKHRTVLEIRVGSTLPVLNSSAGRIFLSFLPRPMTQKVIDAEMADMLPLSKRSAPSLEAEIKRVVAETRRDGAAHVSGTMLTGFTSLAAPIWDHAGTVQTVVSIVGPIGVLDDDVDGLPARILKRMTLDLSTQMGWQGKEKRQITERKPAQQRRAVVG